jgi:hypothetical protein
VFALGLRQGLLGFAAERWARRALARAEPAAIPPAASR